MPRGTTLHKLNPCERLDACINNIIEHHSDAQLCVITGDITDRGDIRAYHDFREIIQRLPMPCHPLIGNHDDRDIFCDNDKYYPYSKLNFLITALGLPVLKHLVLILT